MTPLELKLMLALGAVGIIGLIFVALIVYEKMKEDAKGKPKTTDQPKSWIEELWEKHGKEIAKSLALISISLGFFNWLCARTEYEWWWTFWYRGSIFWITQIAIVFSIYAVMTAPKKIAKLFGIIVLVTAVGSWVYVVWKSEDSPSIEEAFDQALAEISDHPTERVIWVKAGGWKKIPVPKDKRIDVTLNPPVDFSLRVNDERKVHRAAPGTYIDTDRIFSANPTHFWFKPDGDTEMTITTKPKS